MTPQLTPAEMRDLLLIRARALRDRGDIAPMERVWWDGDYRDPERERHSAVIPWLVAVNLEVQ